VGQLLGCLVRLQIANGGVQADEVGALLLAGKVTPAAVAEVDRAAFARAAAQRVAHPLVPVPRTAWQPLRRQGGSAREQRALERCNMSRRCLIHAPHPHGLRPGQGLQQRAPHLVVCRFAALALLPIVHAIGGKTCLAAPLGPKCATAKQVLQNFLRDWLVQTGGTTTGVCKWVMSLPCPVFQAMS
jgi:hypothetical protein